MAAIFSGSVTTTHSHCWPFEPVGAWSATSRHSVMVSSSIGLSKSMRLRTARVVVRTSSAERFSFGIRPP